MDIRLRPRCANQSNCVAPLANTLEVYDYLLQHGAHIDIANVTRHMDHYEKTMTSSTKPEVHNVLHCRQKTTERRPQLTCTGNFVKFRHVVLNIKRVDRQIDRQKLTAILAAAK